MRMSSEGCASWRRALAQWALALWASMKRIELRLLSMICLSLWYGSYRVFATGGTWARVWHVRNSASTVAHALACPRFSSTQSAHLR